MRGLTALERQALEMAAGARARVLADPGTPLDAARMALKSSRRITFAWFPYPDRVRTHATDLGRLALRVCPTEEA